MKNNLLSKFRNIILVLFIFTAVLLPVKAEETGEIPMNRSKLTIYMYDNNGDLIGEPQCYYLDDINTYSLNSVTRYTTVSKTFTSAANSKTYVTVYSNMTYKNEDQILTYYSNSFTYTKNYAGVSSVVLSAISESQTGDRDQGKPLIVLFGYDIYYNYTPSGELYPTNLLGSYEIY